MGGDHEHIAVCPSCECRYRVPEEFQGKPLSCRKCGTVLKLGEPAGAKPEEAQKAEQKGQQGAVTVSCDDPSLVLGRLAIKNQCASEAQVREAISFQAQEKREGRERPLGEILLAKGVISQNQLDYLLSVQRLIETRDLDRRFGTIAVKNGFVTQEQIDRALEEQKRLFRETKSVKWIGDILVESGVMGVAERDGVLKAQKRVADESEKGEREKDSPKKVPGHKSAFSLAVSDDGLQASISALAEGAERASIQEIKSLLASRGITHGIVDDALIEGYLKYKIRENKPFIIAEGRAPAPGRDAEITYYFDTDPLKVGKIKEGDYIDFKDRGSIPQVKEGELIAEKIVPKKGETGIDVFGKHIPAPKAKDIRVRVGHGARTSDDKLKVFATVNGRPEVTADHKLYVFPNMEIPGDVDLKTGHVDFEGNIVVGGTVQSGFRVKGGDLTANEILKADIETSGDIVVFGGIIGATVRTRGNIRAMYVHAAHIEALGDIAVEKEIIDSKLETSGSCIIKKGHILSAHISAKKGIEALRVGSEASRPCTLAVGTDERVKNEIESLKQALSLKKEEEKGTRENIGALEEESQKIHQGMGTVAQDQDRALVSQRKLRNKVDQARKAGGSAQLKEVESAIQTLEQKIREGEKVLEAHLDKQDKTMEEISACQQKLKTLAEEMNHLEEEMLALAEWSESEKANPIIMVHGEIHQDSSIKGIFSSLILPESHKGVLIKETKMRGADDRLDWRIKISRLG